jgi:hypothetical protein
VRGLSWSMPTTTLVRRTQSNRVDFAFPASHDAGGTYKTAAALPMPAKLLWSVAICDARTGEEMCFDRESQANATFEVRDESLASCPKMHLGPIVPSGARRHWIKTVAGRGWFAYRRVCVPSSPRSMSIRNESSLARSRAPASDIRA